MDCAARLAFQDRANRELWVTMTFIRLGALPRAAQLVAAGAMKGLADVSGLGHGELLSGTFFIPCPRDMLQYHAKNLPDIPNFTSIASHIVYP